MIATHGLSHIALAVEDPERSLAFYRDVFGVREYFRDALTIQVQGPGAYDVLAFESRPREAGAPGGIIHFGLRLTRAGDIDAAVAAVAAVEAAGGHARHSRRVRAGTSVRVRSRSGRLRDRDLVRVGCAAQPGTAAGEERAVLYMIIEQFPPGAAPAIYRRARERGRQLPDGLAYLDSWVDLDYSRCFQLMRTEDPALLELWMQRWNDLVRFEVVAVRTSAEAAARLVAEAPR